MVEQNLLCPTCRNDNSFFEEKISWQDLRGLSWLFCEDCTDQTDESIKASFACA